MEGKKAKKRIVPQQVEIRDWMVPRRPFQPVVRVEETGGLRVVQESIEEGDTSELLESSVSESESGTEDRVGSRGTATVVPTGEQLRTISKMTGEEARASSIPLAFWRNVTHVLNQYEEWCGTTNSAEALSSHEANLLDLIETTLRSSTRITRRRRRREAALEQLKFGLSQADSFSTNAEGLRIEEARGELSEMEDRKKSLEASINSRTRRLKDTPTQPPSIEPEYIQDGAERLALQVVRREIAEKAKEVEGLGGGMVAVVSRARILQDEDSSQYKGFVKYEGRFTLMRLLGKGGYSEVWKAFDRGAGGYVAVKIHQFSDAWSQEQKIAYVKHARRETAIHRKMTHRNIVNLITTFDISEVSFATVLEHTPRTDLATHLIAHRTLRERDARIIIAQVLSALSYLNDLPDGSVIHYDLKPANILFFGDFDVKITDFGLSKQLEAASSTTELTSNGAGTLWYLPPECFKGPTSAEVTTKVDVWSAGVVYYQTLYGKRPFCHDQPQRALLLEGAMSRAARELDFPPTPKISKPTIDIMKNMFAYHPSNRPTAAAVLQEMFQVEDDGDTPNELGDEPPAKKAKK